MMEKPVIFVVASEGYQPIEYQVPKQLLEKAGYEVLTASDALGTAKAKDGSETKIDMLVQNIPSSDCIGVFFIGGPGALEHLDNDVSYKLIHTINEEKKPLGAICVSTRILAKAGVLKNKSATGWNGDNELPALYKEHEVKYIPQDVVVDGTIITATDPNTAREFGQQLITLLQDYSKAHNGG